MLLCHGQGIVPRKEELYKKMTGDKLLDAVPTYVLETWIAAASFE